MNGTVTVVRAIGRSGGCWRRDHAALIAAAGFGLALVVILVLAGRGSLHGAVFTLGMLRLGLALKVGAGQPGGV